MGLEVPPAAFRSDHMIGVRLTRCALPTHTLMTTFLISVHTKRCCLKHSTPKKTQPVLAGARAAELLTTGAVCSQRARAGRHRTAGNAGAHPIPPPPTHSHTHTPPPPPPPPPLPSIHHTPLVSVAEQLIARRCRAVGHLGVTWIGAGCGAARARGACLYPWDGDTDLAAPVEHRGRHRCAVRRAEGAAPAEGPALIADGGLAGEVVH